MYSSADDVLILETTNFTEVDTWPLSRPIEPGLGRVNFGSVDDFNEEPGFFTGLFTTTDPIQNRRIMSIGRVNLVAKSIDLTPIGPAEGVSFALTLDRKRAYGLVQGNGGAQPIGRFEFWAFDVARRSPQTHAFEGRPPWRCVRRTANGSTLPAGVPRRLRPPSYKRLRTSDERGSDTTCTTAAQQGTGTLGPKAAMDAGVRYGP